MHNESKGRSPGRESGLPRVVSVEAKRVRYARPRRYFVGQELKEAREAVEILLRTASPLHFTGDGPVLFIGDEPIVEGGAVGLNLYRFFVFDFAHLPAGASISLGLSDSPASKVPTSFSFDPGGGVA
jgi:hypothetical protein